MFRNFSKLPFNRVDVKYIYRDNDCVQYMIGWLQVKYLIPPSARPFYSVLYSVITIRYNALELVSEMKIKFGDETHW